MSKMDDIKQAVSQLTPDEVKALSAWLDELQAGLWDRQIEQDIKAGKLETLGAKWRADHEAGRSTDLEPPSRSGKA